MKLLLKLIVIAVIINGAYHIGFDEYRASQLKDSVHSMLVLGTKTPIEDLKLQMLQKADDLKLPVTAEKLTLAREGIRTTVKIDYGTEPEVFPGYKYPRDHSFTDEISAIH